MDTPTQELIAVSSVVVVRIDLATRNAELEQEIRELQQHIERQEHALRVLREAMATVLLDCFG